MALSQRRRLLVRRLHHRKTRAREGLVLVEGVRAVAEALTAGADVRFLVASPRLTRTPGGTELLALGAAHGIPVEATDPGDFASLSDTDHPQGVLAVCAEPRHGPEIVRESGRYLVLDGIQDPGNVGTLVRAAVAFGLDGVLALDGTADPWGTRAVRASAGMVFRAQVLALGFEEALDRFGEQAVDLLAADASGAGVGSSRPAGGWALVLGNEGSGIREELLQAASRRVAVSMEGPAESLNVAMAGAILLYVLTREKARA